MVRQTISILLVILFSLVILVYLWWGRFQYQHEKYLLFTYVLCISAVFFSHLFFRDSPKELGIRLDNWKTSIGLYGGLTFGAGILITLAGSFSSVGGVLEPRHIVLYFLWAGAQQYLLQNFIRLRLVSAMAPAKHLGRSTQVLAAAGSALIFAVFHAPETSLFILTLVGGFVWCLLFSYVPNFFAVWFSQAIIGCLLILFFKQGALEQFQVGKPGFRYEGYGEGVQVAAGYDEAARPLVATLPGPIPSNSALVRVFTGQGVLLSEWEAFDSSGYSGRIAFGDLGFGPGDELAICPGPGPGNPSRIRIFDRSGVLLGEFPIPQLGDQYGCWPSIQNGLLYVAPGPAPEAPQLILEIDSNGAILRQWRLDLHEFKNSIKAVLYRPNRDDPGSEKVLAWGTAVAQNPSKIVVWDPSDQNHIEIETLPTTFGASLTLFRLGKERNGIAVGPGPFMGYPAWIKIFALEPEVEVVSDIAPYEVENSCGVNLAAVDLDQDGVDELVIGEGTGKGRPPTVRICRIDGEILEEWTAYPPD